MTEPEADGGTPTPTLIPFVLPLRAEHYRVWDARGLPMGEIDLPETATHIVHCVNLYPELIEALRAIAERQDDDLPARIARSVLAKVKP